MNTGSMPGERGLKSQTSQLFHIGKAGPARNSAEERDDHALYHAKTLGLTKVNSSHDFGAVRDAGRTGDIEVERVDDLDPTNYEQYRSQSMFQLSGDEMNSLEEELMPLQNPAPRSKKQKAKKALAESEAEDARVIKQTTDE